MKVLIVDNFDSFTYNLYQDVGQILERSGINFKLEVFRNNQKTAQEIKKQNFDKIIISPGPGVPSDRDYFGVCAEILTDISKTVPTLGVCLGMQGICYYYGGEIVKAPKAVHGETSLIKHDSSLLFKGLDNNLEVMRYHSLIANKENLPEDLLITATTKEGLVMGLNHKKYPIYGLQFHPESFATEGGKTMLSNFLFA